MVLGHTNCGAIKGAVQNVDLGHLHFITHKIQRCIPGIAKRHPHIKDDSLCAMVTKANVLQGISDLKHKSTILADMAYKGEIKIIGGVYDISTGLIEFYENEVEG